MNSQVHSQQIQTPHCFLITCETFLNVHKHKMGLILSPLVGPTLKILEVNNWMIYFLFCSYVKMILAECSSSGYLLNNLLNGSSWRSGLLKVANPRRKWNIVPWFTSTSSLLNTLFFLPAIEKLYFLRHTRCVIFAVLITPPAPRSLTITLKSIHCNNSALCRKRTITKPFQYNH